MPVQEPIEPPATEQEPKQPRDALPTIMPNLATSNFSLGWIAPEDLRMPPEFQRFFDSVHAQAAPLGEGGSRDRYEMVAVHGAFVRFPNGLPNKGALQISGLDDCTGQTRAVKFVRASNDNGPVLPEAVYFLKLTGLGPKCPGPRLIPVFGTPPADMPVFELR